MLGPAAKGVAGLSTHLIKGPERGWRLTCAEIILQNSILGEAVGKIEFSKCNKDAKIMQARKAQSKLTAFTQSGSCVETGSGFRPCIFLFSFFFF